MARLRFVFVIVVGLFLLTPPARAFSPHLGLSPSVGPPTIQVTASGSGFGASEVVHVTFSGVLVSTVTTDATGAFTATFSVPAKAQPGTRTVLAHGQAGDFVTTTFLVRTNWPQFHFDNAHTGFNPYENTLGRSNVGELVQKWAVGTASGASPSPVVSGGLVYVAPTDGVVRALDPATGAMVWSYNTGSAMSGAAPAVSAGVLYVGNEAGKLFALGASTGRLIWSVDLDAGVYDPPVVASAQVFVNSDRLNAVDEATGTILWKGTGGYQPPTVAGTDVYSDLFAIGATIVARGAQHGRLLWFQELCSEGCNMGGPSVADGRVTFMVDNLLTGLDAGTGAFLWEADGGNSSVVPTLGSGVAYMAGDSVTPIITARNASNGDLVWQVPGPGSGTQSSSIALANGVLYVGSDDGHLWAYNSSTGAVLWQSPQELAAVKGYPAVSDGVVYAGSDDGTVYAFGLP